MNCAALQFFKLPAYRFVYAAFWPLLLAHSCWAQPESIDTAIRTICYSGRSNDSDQKLIIDACQKLFKLPGTDNNTKADIYNMYGVLAQDRGDNAAALPYFEQSLKFRPDYGYPLQNKASALLALQRCQEAFELYQKRAQLPENSYVGTFGLGAALACQKKYKEALPYYNDALTEAPHNESYYLARGRILLITGNGKKAIEDGEAAARLDPDEHSYTYQALQLSMGAKDFDKADELVKKYLVLEPNNGFGMLQQYLLSLERKKPAPEALSARVAGVSDQRNWFRALGSFILGKISETQLAFYTKGDDQADQQLRLLHAAYYAGEIMLLKGDQVAAREKFNVASGMEGVADYAEYWNALARLHQLEKH